MTTTALIIDDEPDIRQLIAMTLSRMGLEHHSAANLEEARQLLNTYDFDICLTDMRLPDGNGVEFVRYVHSIKPNLPVAVITAHGNMEAAVEAMKNGAYDFVSKPVDIRLLRQLVVQAVTLNSEDGIKEASNDENFIVTRNTNAQRDADKLDCSDDADAQNRNSDTPIEKDQNTDSNLHSLSGRNNTQSRNSRSAELLAIGAHKLIGSSESMRTLRQMIAKVARTNAPVWITGESGTGKELIAKLIHANSARGENAFVAINCGAIPSELMESELFGHLKGSFTGANTNKDGLFQLADGGTLFLDEVAELPLHMQVKLLRAIQERSIRPVGGNSELPVDARILSASHKDLAIEVDAGRFRHDLYYRLNVISLHSPSLRDRSEDIPELCASIMEKLGSQSATSTTKYVSDDALAAMAGYHFPGNVRELENMLERALALVESDTICADDLQLKATTAARVSAFDTNTEHLTPVNPVANPVAGPIASPIASPITNDESKKILDALNTTRWNRKAAAKLLGLTYRQLRYRIQQLDIDRKQK